MTTIETPSVIRHLWKSVLALGVLTLVLGAAVLIWPGDSIVVASVVFGVYLLVSGIAQAIAAFTVGMSPASRVLFFITAHCRSCWATSPSATSTTAPPCGCWPYGSALDSYSKVSRRRVGDRCSRIARARLVHLCRDPDCDRRRGDHRLADQLHRGARDRRRAWLVVVGITEVVWALSARRTVKKGSAVSRSRWRPAPPADTPSPWPRRDWTRQPHAPTGIAAVGSKVTRV